MSSKSDKIINNNEINNKINADFEEYLRIYFDVNENENNNKISDGDKKINQDIKNTLLNFYNNNPECKYIKTNINISYGSDVDSVNEMWVCRNDFVIFSHFKVFVENIGSEVDLCLRLSKQVWSYEPLDNDDQNNNKGIYGDCINEFFEESYKSIIINENDTTIDNSGIIKDNPSGIYECLRSRKSLDVYKPYYKSEGKWFKNESQIKIEDPGIEYYQNKNQKNIYNTNKLCSII